MSLGGASVAWIDSSARPCVELEGGIGEFVRWATYGHHEQIGTISRDEQATERFGSPVLNRG
jgi:hypothetical protein